MTVSAFDPVPFSPQGGDGNPLAGKFGDPKRPAFLGLAVILAFLAALGLWSVLAPVSSAAIAEGSLSVEGRRQTVQHPYGGVVEKLTVREGERVERGQVLMVLSDAEPRAKLNVLESERNALRAQEARLVAERDGAKEPAFGQDLTSRAADPAVAQAMANERAILSARWRQHDAEAGMLRQKVAQLKEQIRGAEAQREGLDRQHALIREEAEGVNKLLANGFAPKTRALALEREAARILADRGARLSEMAGAQEAVASAELELAKLERARLTEVTSQLRETQSKLAELGPRLDAARDVVDRTRVTAPATGSVVGLTIFTEGGVVQPGAKLMDIVPSGNPLMVEARLHLNDVSEVSAGRSADVRLTSVNRMERPTLRGEVTNVSADRLTDERTGEGYYSIQVRLNPEDVRASRVDLQPGMPAQVIVTTQPRTLMEYIAGPLIDEITGAFRER